MKCICGYADKYEDYRELAYDTPELRKQMWNELYKEYGNFKQMIVQTIDEDGNGSFETFYICPCCGTIKIKGE